MILPKPHLIKRTKDIAWLLIKHGHRDLVDRVGLASLLGDELPADVRADADELAGDLERLGPTFVKLGQVLASRSDLLPPPYLEALGRLQDAVEPFSGERVKEIVERELGIRLSKAFADFAFEPIAAASLGQVHRANLRDGREVAVKVQRPDIVEQITDDLDALEEIAKAFDRHTKIGRSIGLRDTVNEFRKSLLDELDYRIEAGNLLRFERMLRRFDLIQVPVPVADYSTSRVLTMEFVSGIKVDELSPLRQIDIDGDALAEELFRAYLWQIVVEGFFHADPHPGNVLLTPENRIALLDVGQVGHIPSSLQESALRLMMAAARGDGEEVAKISLRISRRGPECDDRAFRREIDDLILRTYQANLEELQVGRLMLEIARIAALNDIKAPPTLSILGKALIQLDEIGQLLHPGFNPREALQRNIAAVTRERAQRDLSPQALLSKAAEIKDLLGSLPGRIDRLFEMITEEELRIKMDVIDERELLRTLQQVANRITSGLVLASIIVGAALLMRVETTFTLFGYPGIAMFFFLFAALGSVWLLFTIFWQDRRITKRSPRPRR